MNDVEEISLTRLCSIFSVTHIFQKYDDFDVDRELQRSRRKREEIRFATKSERQVLKTKLKNTGQHRLNNEQK